ncbi:MAG: acetylglutamate kinase [Deltaproteobacteria bacterium]|nr:acetylglutamate kinase [Deltaproteobacteria bacterium]
MDEIINKTKVLMEAMPYIRKFRGKTFVIKYGGSAMVDEALKEGFAKDIVMLKYIGINPVIVHGGGPQIGEVLAKMGMESKFHKGVRITDDATMDVVEMVLAGQVNQEIVRLINRHGGKAVGYSGVDGNMIKAKKLPKEKVTFDKKVKEIIDLGRVGNVTEIDCSIITSNTSELSIPVIAPLGVSSEGEVLNINADLVAGAMAVALRAEKLILLTDVAGVLDDEGKLIHSLSHKTVKEWKEKGVISGGMIPKIKSCLDAVEKGVKSVHIIDGRVPHSILLEVFTDVGIGTVITE